MLNTDRPTESPKVPPTAAIMSSRSYKSTSFSIGLVSVVTSAKVASFFTSSEGSKF